MTDLFDVSRKMGIRALMISSILLCIFTTTSATATPITEADFGGDFNGDVFDSSLFTDIGSIGPGISTISGVSEAGTSADALIFSTNGDILSISIELFGSSPIGGFGVIFGTGSVIEFAGVGGTGDIFTSNSLVVPSSTSLSAVSLSAGNFFFGLDDANAGINYVITMDIAGVPVPEPSTLAIFALGIMGLAARRFKKQ